jgi:hypothetical protein
MRHLIADFDAGPKSASRKFAVDPAPISSNSVSGQVTGTFPSTRLLAGTAKKLMCRIELRDVMTL